MGIAAIAVLIGVSIGIARGGTVERLLRLDLRSPGWLVASVCTHALALIAHVSSADRTIVIGLVGISYLLLIRWVGTYWRGHSHLGVASILAGLASNTLVTIVNGGMPVSLHADSIKHGVEATKHQVESYRHVAADPNTVAPWLGDILPIRPIAVVSPGDILIAVGIVAFVAAATTRSIAGDQPLDDVPVEQS